MSIFRKINSPVGCRIDLKEKIFRKQDTREMLLQSSWWYSDHMGFEILVNSMTYGSSKRNTLHDCDDYVQTKQWVLVSPRRHSAQDSRLAT